MPRCDDACSLLAVVVCDEEAAEATKSGVNSVTTRAAAGCGPAPPVADAASQRSAVTACGACDPSVDVPSASECTPSHGCAVECSASLSTLPLPSPHWTTLGTQMVSVCMVTTRSAAHGGANGPGTWAFWPCWFLGKPHPKTIPLQAAARHGRRCGQEAGRWRWRGQENHHVACEGSGKAALCRAVVVARLVARTPNTVPPSLSRARTAVVAPACDQLVIRAFQGMCWLAGCGEATVAPPDSVSVVALVLVALRRPTKRPRSR